jgi:hypothetical protein
VESCATWVKQGGLEPAERDQAFFVVLDRVARDSLTAIALVLTQSAGNSQVIDNLNAPIHPNRSPSCFGSNPSVSL